MELSFTKILVILFVGFLVFGPDKLPALGRAAGKALSEFKQATSGLTQDIRKSDSENKEDKEDKQI
ncbi:twin-arginine translocase TatAC [Bacillus subtilis]|uniref:twin-arginine translocase TatAC n=1 Tax=Bacillus subtilis TaxID=1423 RepID=UPI002282FCE4|nr:twin-arginine translocase TatAC [Bacillus subtilis]MCY8208616.1 twin-arginine translocase TatAC [Bacillus subtilis]